MYFILMYTDKCTGQLRCRSTPRDRLPELRGLAFSKQNTFPCYRASQLRGSTRGPLFTAHIKPSVNA